VLRQSPDVTPRRATGARAVVAGAVLTLLAQVAYPLTDGEALRWLTIGTVVLFAATMVGHAWATRGGAWALAFTVVAAGGGLLVEGIGLRTGLPFGDYSYAHSLGPTLWRVPVVVPLAWSMMAYPCLLLGRTLSARLVRASRRRRRPASGRRRDRPSVIVVAALGGWAMAAWDLFLDPQMVAAGHWVWRHPHPGLPGTSQVPVTNALGWLLAGVVLMGLLHVVLPSRSDRGGHHERHVGLSDLVPASLLAWTWLGSTLANAVFFDRPAVAAWGGLLLGVVTLPYLLVLWGRRP
jgi:putative membrane protein